METSHEGGTNQIVGAPSQSDANHSTPQTSAGHQVDSKPDTAHSQVHSIDSISSGPSQPVHQAHAVSKPATSPTDDQQPSVFGHDTVSAGVLSSDTTHKMLHPNQDFMQEIKDNPRQTHQPTPAQPVTAPPVPAVFADIPPGASQPVTTPAEAAIANQMNQPTNAVAASPSGRWQTFWYALSVLTLGILVIDTATATSWGTLNKILAGFKPNPADHLFGTRIDIIMANILLGSLLVCLPLFIIATVKVDRYLLSHPKLPTSSMKKIAYIVLVIVTLSIISNLGSAIFQLLNYTFDIVTGVSILTDILFAVGYGFWLYTTVAEDRKE